MELGFALGAVVLSFAAWGFMFLLPRNDIWPRTWVAATGLVTYSVIALIALDRLGETFGPFTPTEVAVGGAVGATWLAATHIGHAVLCRMIPAFEAQVRDLYRLGDGDSVARMVGPVVAMGVAEELLFRGVIQGAAGLVGGVIAYTAVQVVERKWALGLAALLGGTVWGALFWWTGGLVAPIVAHVLWTSTLTFVFPLRGCGRRAVSAAPLAETETDRVSARAGRA